MPLRGSFPALAHRNFRLLWIGQLVSTAGSMMQNTAVLWHVTLLVPAEDKALALGQVSLVRFVPIVAFSLFSGAIADAVDRRKLMLAAQAVMTLSAALLASLTLRGVEDLTSLYALIALHSAASSFDGPARQALVPGLVPKEHLANALNLNTLLFHAANVIGPPLAGLVMAGWSVGWVYLLNALSFLAVIGALVAMRGIDARPAGAAAEVSLKAVGEGLRFVFREPMIRTTMLVDFFATFFSAASVLLPMYVQDIYAAGEKAYGLLYAAEFWGALLAGVVLVRALSSIERPGRAFFWSVVVYGAATIGFGFAANVTGAWVWLALAGAADMLSTVIRNVVRQTLTPAHLRGRMTSVSMIFFMGGPQLGNYEAGWVADRFGPVTSVVSGGILCIVACVVIAWRTPELWRYRGARAA